MLCDVYGSFESLALERCTYAHGCTSTCCCHRSYIIRVTAVIDDVQDGSNNQNESAVMLVHCI